MASEIYSTESMSEAAYIIQNHSLILIIGDQVHPVPLNDYLALRQKMYRTTGRHLTREELCPLLFSQYERVRLVTSNRLPHYNYVCVVRLIRRGRVRSVVTPNFDNYLASALGRYGGPLKGTMNPCVKDTSREWCSDGYYSPLPCSPSQVPIWKIHGDLGFARMLECGHVFALPKFMIEPPRTHESESDPPLCCHFIALTEDGCRFKADTRLFLEHPSQLGYRHNIDFWFAQGVFWREKEAAAEELKDHCSKGGAVFIMGMTFNPNFGEDLLHILLDLPMSTPIIYLVASKGREISAQDSELLDGLVRGGRPYVLINEVNRRGAIEDSLVELLSVAGETGINDEYTGWKMDNKWW